MYQKQRTSKSYSIASPYMELLESKKKVYGLKYHSSIGGGGSHSKSTHNQNTSALNASSVKGRPHSSSLASNHNKSAMKSNSSQKVKSTKSQNPKKKRIYTEQTENIKEINSDPKLHESLFVSIDNKNALHQLASKSLFPNEPVFQKNNYLNNYDFLKKFTDFNAQLKDKHQHHPNFSGSKSQKSNKSAKSKEKNPKNNSNQQVKSINFDNVMIRKSIEQLGLTEVEDLICLIDNCVQEANEYISFLASKVESLKNQLMKCKAEEFQLERIIKEKNKELETKDLLISKLKKQMDSNKQSQKSTKQHSFNLPNQDESKTKQMRKILEVLNEMNERNQFLQSKVKGLEQELLRKRKQKYPAHEQEGDEEGKAREKRKCSNGKDVYNQIHSKIDILNISIDNNKKSNQNTNNYSQLFENERSDQKKYKFIKLKNK